MDEMLLPPSLIDTSSEVRQERAAKTFRTHVDTRCSILKMSLPMARQGVHDFLQGPLKGKLKEALFWNPSDASEKNSGVIRMAGIPPLCHFNQRVDRQRMQPVKYLRVSGSRQSQKHRPRLVAVGPSTGDHQANEILGWNLLRQTG